MKKILRRLSAFLLTGLLLLSAMFVNPVNVKAEEGDGYTIFLGYGGENEANSWNMCWANESGYEGDIVPATATVKEGDTVTIGLTFPTAVTHTYWMAPTILASGVEELEYTLDSIKLDGKDVLGDIDLTRGDDEWWYEATGNFSADEAIRLKGGYNDWAEQAFTESPSGFTTVEYTITVTKLVVGDGAPAGEVVASTESYDAFIALGADGVSTEAWGLQYYGDGADNNMGEIEAVNGKLTNGETTTLSLTLPDEVLYTWFVAPCMIVPDTSVISADSTFDVKVYLDGEEITTDLTAGKSCWAEGTGSYDETACIRIGGGYNEWGDKYIAESPVGYKTITFEITPNILIASGAAEEETTTEAAASADFDANGTYNVYIGIQSANWSFRNSFNDGTYGADTEYFNQITGWDSANNAVVREGKINDAVIEGNGTYTVSITGLDLADDSETLNLLFLSTDIPLNSGVAFTDISIRMGGKTVYEFDEAFLDPDDTEYIKPLFINIWNKELTADNEFAYTLSAGMDIEITFTVSGFDYDNANAAGGEKDTAAAETTKAAETTTAAETTAASASADGEGGVSAGVIIAIIAAVVVVAAIVVVAVKKKKA